MIALLLAAVLAYWPGVEGGDYDVEPVYDHRIPVIDTIGVRDRKAIQEWNACGSVRLFVADRKPFSPGTITITTGEKGDWPRGGWMGDHGALFLPPGSWERSIPVMRHEFGHALGFGHTKKWSIMGGSNHVQPIDCDGLLRYYG